MTQQRRDSHSTEFGLWLRQQADIDSKLGYIATNIDYMWNNYKSHEWMLIEEKRYGSQVKYPQDGMFKTIHNACRSDPNYRGFHFLVFEKTSPDDGWIKLDGKLISKEQLIKFLQFKSIE